MDNDLHKHDVNEDEYHLPETDGQHAFGNQPDQYLQRARRRKILLIVGILAAILAIYKLLGFFLSGQPTKKSPSAPTAITKITPPAPTSTTTTPPPTAIPLTSPVSEPVVAETTATTTTPSTTTASTPTSASSTSTAMESQLPEKPSLLREMTTTQPAISKVARQMGSVSSSLTDVNLKLAQLNERLDAMQTVIKQKQEITTTHYVKKGCVIKRARPCYHRYIINRPPRERYYIQAIIPGRAWLISCGDHTMTVAWGDIIPGYGKVTLIDPVKGVVVTNKGVIIRFRNE